MIKAYKLYTGEDGHSHIARGLMIENQLFSAKSTMFKETAPWSTYDWHTAPAIQYVISLTGTLEFEVFSGETFVLKPGEVLIAMDTTGSGHKWKLVDNEAWRRAYIAFDPAPEANFIEDDAVNL